MGGEIPCGVACVVNKVYILSKTTDNNEALTNLHESEYFMTREDEGTAYYSGTKLIMLLGVLTSNLPSSSEAR